MYLGELLDEEPVSEQNKLLSFAAKESEGLTPANIELLCNEIINAMSYSTGNLEDAGLSPDQLKQAIAKKKEQAKEHGQE
jgi:hypothetical protein